MYVRLQPPHPIIGNPSIKEYQINTNKYDT